MKSLGEIMNEMGFNKEASDTSKKAFIKHLINAANLQEKNKALNSLNEKPKAETKTEQLSLFEQKTNTKVG